MAGTPAVALAVLAAALAADAWAPAGPDGQSTGAQCGPGAAAPLPPCAAAQEQRGARMSIAVALADDLLVMGEGGVHLRGDVLVGNYDPREGHMFQEIRAEPSGRIVSKSKIFLRTGSGGEWAAQVGATLKPEDYPPGSYSIGAVTESGLRSPRAMFAVSEGQAAAGEAALDIPPPSTPPPPNGGSIPPNDPTPAAGPAEATDVPPDAPAGLARLDAPAGLPELPELPDAASAVLPGGALPEGAGPPVQPKGASAPSGTPPPPASSGLPPPPSDVPTGRPSGPDPGRGSGLLDQLAGLLTAGYIVAIIVSAIVSFVAMMLVRAALRRLARRRRRPGAPRARRP